MMRKLFGTALVLAVAAFLPYSISSSPDGAVRISQNRLCAQSGCGCISAPNRYCYNCGAAGWNFYCNFGCLEPPE